MQAETRNIRFLGFDASYIRDFTVPRFVSFDTETGKVQCKCRGNLANETIDLGYAGNWLLFPLVSLRLGDTGHSWEYAKEYVNFRVGPLVCEQGKSIICAQNSWLQVGPPSNQNVSYTSLLYFKQRLR